nr:DUF932 domain-containing protein [Scandinavium goeteborgense]
MFRQVCTHDLVAWEYFGEISVHHKVDIFTQVIESAYQVLKTFDNVVGSIEQMRSVQFSEREQLIFGATALEHEYDGGHAPITPTSIINHLHW